MMRFNFIFILICSFGFGQKLSDLKLFGKVKSLESTTYLVSDMSKTTHSGFLDSESFDKIKLNFDQKGNLVSRENYLDYQGKLGLFDKTDFRYNSINLIEKQQTTLVQNGEEPTKISQVKTFYYIGSQLIRKDEFNSGRTTNQYWVTNFNYAGGRLKKKEFWMEDEIFSISEIENRLYKIISEKTIHNDGKIGQIILYDYDENQNLKQKTTESGNEKTVETFNYEGNLLKEYIIENKKGEIQLKETFDENGFPVRIEKINYRKKSLSDFEFKYELDAQKNWVNCVILEDKTPKFKIIRTINYY